MPELCRFYGIIIRMNNLEAEHDPPHIHVVYNEYQAMYDIQKLAMIKGDLPNRARKLTQEWIEIHQTELIEMWNTQNFSKLNPLD